MTELEHARLLSSQTESHELKRPLVPSRDLTRFTFYRPQMRGLTPRVFEDLFARIEELKANVEVRLMQHPYKCPMISVAAVMHTRPVCTLLGWLCSSEQPHGQCTACSAPDLRP